MIKFKQKDFSFLGKVTNGAVIGAGIGGTVAKFRNKLKIPKKFGELEIMAGGALVGAALGAAAGLFVEGEKLISRRNVDKRLLEKVVEDLKKTGFKESTDFTRDPKKANEMKTKVCLVVSKHSGDLRVLINTANDSKLAQLTNRVTKNIPNVSAVTKKASDKFNELTITTISDSSADVGLVAGLAESFIRSKYPVYLIEVG